MFHSLIAFCPQVDLVLGEPNFSAIVLPWHNLRYWFILDSLRSSLGDAKICPMSAELWAVPVEFRDLWKIRAPLRTVEGFDMAEFDHIVLVRKRQQTFIFK